MESIRRRLTTGINIYGLVLSNLIERGLYYRETETRINSEGRPQLWDVISQWWMSTEFAISRFLTPHLAGDGLAAFADCDILCRSNLVRLFEDIENGKYGSGKALWCVKHNHQPDNSVKMDGQIQAAYSRKNWSSVMVFDCDHPANKKLTVELVNTLPGRDLHRFCWLDDDEIGELPAEYNWLAGHSDPSIEPKIVHHTDGSPCMAGFENAPFADEWRDELTRWARPDA